MTTDLRLANGYQCPTNKRIRRLNRASMFSNGVPHTSQGKIRALAMKTRNSPKTKARYGHSRALVEALLLSEDAIAESGGSSPRCIRSDT